MILGTLLALHRVRGAIGGVREFAHGSTQGARGNIRACLGVGPELFEPAPQRCHHVRRQHAQFVERRFLHHENGRVGQAFLVQHPAQVVLDFHRRRRLHTIQHHGHGDVAAGRIAQQLPRHRIRIAIGGRDEQPQVSRGEQLSGKRPVVVRDGVDVRSIEHREALGDLLVSQQHQGAGVLDRTIAVVGGRSRDGGIHELAADARQVREDTLGSERSGVVGVVNQERSARGGTNRTGSGHRVPHERVDQRGFTRAGGAADHREQRGVQGSDARQHVIVKLGNGPTDGLALLRRTGRGEGQRGGAQQVSGLLKRFDQRSGRCVFGAHAAIVPVFRRLRGVSRETPRTVAQRRSSSVRTSANARGTTL